MPVLRHFAGLPDAALGEFWEEAGIYVEPVRILGVFGGPEFCITYENGDVVLYTSIIFEVRRIGGDLRPDGREALELRFASCQEAAELPMTIWTRKKMLEVAFERGQAPYFTPATWRPPRV